MTDETDIWKMPLGAFKKGVRPKGHAARIGSGPHDETCGTCRHLVKLQCARPYFKCGLMRQHWTSGIATDVRKKDAACHYWMSKEQTPKP